MKKVLLSLLFLATLSMSAQETEFESPIKKGRVSLAGRIGINRSNSDRTSAFDSNTTNIRFRPSVGYVVDDNFVLGFALGVVYNEFESESNNTTVKNLNRDYYAGVFVKKYIPIINRLLFDFTGNIGVNRGSNSHANYLNHSFNISISPGISYFLSNKLALQMNIGGLGYSYGEVKDTSIDNVESKSSSIGLNLNSSDVRFGFVYFL